MDTLQVWRDLHWLIHSPNLLSANAGLPLAQWPDDMLRQLDDWLGQEYHKPEYLTPDVAEGYRRLGLYAEAVLGLALQHNPDVELLAAHAPVHTEAEPDQPDSTRRTLGELDFVFRDRHSGQVCHWEMAVKLYLFVPALPTAMGLARYVGLQQRDTLARKTAKLQEQLHFSSLPQVTQKLDVAVDRAEAFVKGWLFYPLQGTGWNDYILDDHVSTDLLGAVHLKGWWMSHDEFVQRLAQLEDTTLRWRIVPRLQWLSPQVAEHQDTMDCAQLRETLRGWFEAEDSKYPGNPAESRDVPTLVAPLSTRTRAAPGRPRSGLLIVALAPVEEAAAGKADYVEVHRGFVVANDWEERLLATPPR